MSRIMDFRILLVPLFSVLGVFQPSLAIADPAGTPPRPVVFIGTPANTGPPPESLESAAGTRSWPFNIGENFGSPILSDLDGNGTMEIISGNRTRLYVLDAQGNVLPGWPKVTGSLDNCPAVADIDEDGSPEVFVTSSSVPPRIHAFHIDGTVQAGFPISLPYGSFLNASSPAIEDVDGDGHLDVGAQSSPGVYFFDRFGAPLPGWPYTWGSDQQNIVWSAPAVADLDGDERMEVVVGNNLLYQWAVHVIRADGTAMPGWPRSTNNIFSGAAVGDLDRDGDLEIAIQEGDPTWYGNRMHVWHHDGTYLTGWPKAIASEWECSRSNPAIVDVDDDGSRVIVTATGDGLLHAFHPDGTEHPGFPLFIADASLISSVQVVEIDADRTAELFLTYRSPAGHQYAGGWRLDGTVLPGFPKLLISSTSLSAHSSMHIADADADGDLDIVAQGQDFDRGQLWLFEIEGSVAGPIAYQTAWPKIRRDLHNTGFNPLQDPAGIAIDLFHGAGQLVCYPNPVDGNGVIQLRMPGEACGILTVLDPAGRRVGLYEWDGISAAAVPVKRLLPCGAPSGVYLLRWTPAGGGRVHQSRVTILRG